MAPPDDATSDATGDHGSTDRSTDRPTDRSTDGVAEEWFAMSALRIALVVVGFVILLFALGQAVGMDLLGLFADALSTQMGRWLVVAFFGLVLIAIAVRGFGMYRE